MNASPFGSDEPTLGMVHVRTTHVGVPITTFGGWLPAGMLNVTTSVSVPTSPHASVTVSVTV